MTTMLIGALTLFNMTLAPGADATRTAPDPRPCRLAIESPKTGDRGGPDLLVKGRAEIAAGHAVVVFAGKEGGMFWPQGTGAARLNANHEFTVLTQLGESRDLGASFTIVAQVLDAAETGKIDEWFALARATGRYPGIPLPPFVQGCGVPPTVTVVKSM